ncbi:hypothetical protein [Tellurirhabdus rosea]|uniref:hypothetical protein n=1 Tax=Tellurirhabdus rosea TaxID=2674997 RepID=UPI0022527039|nr:hypothetical protein [Tellurirhabdus rosea]
MATPLTQYVVELEQSGPSGWVNYREPALALRFAYEQLLNSAYIFVPGDEQWPAYCRSAGARSASQRRSEIMQRIAADLAKRRSALANVNDFGIELLF